MAAYLWSALRSLTIAREFKNVGFADLQILSSEITKFLLVNTGYDSIEKLEEKVEKLEKERKDLISTCRGAVSTATTASNYVDGLKKTVAALEKRIQKLEQKK